MVCTPNGISWLHLTWEKDVLLFIQRYISGKEDMASISWRKSSRRIAVHLPLCCICEELLSTFRLDSLRNSHPVEFPVSSVGDIGQVYLPYSLAV